MKTFTVLNASHADVANFSSEFGGLRQSITLSDIASTTGVQLHRPVASCESQAKLLTAGDLASIDGSDSVPSNSIKKSTQADSFDAQTAAKTAAASLPAARPDRFAVVRENPMEECTLMTTLSESSVHVPNLSSRCEPAQVRRVENRKWIVSPRRSARLVETSRQYHDPALPALHIPLSPSLPLADYTSSADGTPLRSDRLAHATTSLGIASAGLEQICSSPPLRPSPVEAASTVEQMTCQAVAMASNLLSSRLGLGEAPSSEPVAGAANLRAGSSPVGGAEQFVCPGYTSERQTTESSTFGGQNELTAELEDQLLDQLAAQIGLLAGPKRPGRRVLNRQTMQAITCQRKWAMWICCLLSINRPFRLPVDQFS
ncbi:unnamed protein product [Protopolystoma xenopodis]|uniref:Uncharacterized protein n=1 Tax=Protopolystoma xenopodis TaxID=117903 RepID=A0A448WE82_9PLAT|nr:unnamed protein product [Protopolystoma xenopodis]